MKSFGILQKARGEMDVQVEFNERLITEVQMQACLYDCNDIAYKNSIRRNDVWDEIAAALACQGNNVLIACTS